MRYPDLIGESRAKLVDELRARFAAKPPGPNDLDAEMLLLSLRGFSYADIAGVFQTSRTTVHKRVSRGRRNAARLLLSKRHTRVVVEVLLTLEQLVSESLAAAARAENGSTEKLLALDRAAAIAMRLYGARVDLGLIARSPKEGRDIAERIERLSLRELQAERERLLHLMASRPKQRADGGKHNA